MIEIERLVKNPYVQIIAILIRFQRSASEAALEEDGANATIAKSEPVIKTDEEGNFKRPKKEEIFRRGSLFIVGEKKGSFLMAPSV